MNRNALRKVRALRQAIALPQCVATLSLIFVFVLAGCTAPVTKSETNGRSTPTASTPSPPISTSNLAPTLTMAQAWGNVTITQVPSLLPNGELFSGTENATPDGQWLIGEVEPRNQLNNQTIYPQIALYNIHTLQLRVISTLRSPQSRIDGLSTDGRWLAWTDAVDPATLYDWVMYVCDLQTGAVRVLATAAHVNGQAAPGPHGGPYVSNGYVIWTESTAPVQQGDLNSLKNELVQEENLATGVITTLAQSAFVESFSWPWVAWGQINATGGGAVDLRNLVTQQRQQLNDEPSTLILDGATAALQDSTGVEVELIPNVAQSITPQVVFAINPADNIQLGYMTLNDRFVAWRGDATVLTPLVYDRAQHVTVTLPTTNAPQPLEADAVGPLLIWSDLAETEAQKQIDDQNGLSSLVMMYIVNVSQLPTKAPGA